MNRLLVALLAAVDALVAAAVGVAVALAPLTVFWVVGFGGAADWGALWPASISLWHLGSLVPLSITLPLEYLTAVGIPAEAATFTLSLAPLAFAGFVAVFAARSGARTARAGAWLTGTAAGIVTTAAVATALWLSASSSIVSVQGWQAVVFPTLVYAVPLLIGALVTAWRVGDDGIIDALHARAARRPDADRIVAAAARGGAAVLAGLLGVGALVFALAVLLRFGTIVSLYEAAHVDAAGATAVTLGHLLYLPVLLVWALSFAAGPGFAVGAGTTVSPAGVHLGVIPGIPVLGVIPEQTTPWLLGLALAVIAVGFAAGAVARRRLAPATGAHEAPTRARLITLAVTIVGAAALAAALAALASGSLGPGRLETVGPAPGPLAFAVGLEIGIGAAVALLTPARMVDRMPMAAGESVAAAAASRVSESAPVAPSAASPVAAFRPVASPEVRPGPSPEVRPVLPPALRPDPDQTETLPFGADDLGSDYLPRPEAPGGAATGDADSDSEGDPESGSSARVD